MSPPHLWTHHLSLPKDSALAVTQSASCTIRSSWVLGPSIQQAGPLGRLPSWLHGPLTFLLLLSAPPHTLPEPLSIFVVSGYSPSAFYLAHPSLALSPHGWTLLSSGVQATRPVHPRRSTAPFAICFSGEPTAGSIMLDTLSCLGSSDVAFSGFCCYAQRSVSSTCRVNIGDVAQDSASLSPRPAPVGQPAL